MSKHVLFIQHTHMDPVWRRCFDRPVTKEGKMLRSYAQIEAACINGWLALAPQGYTFSEGQVTIWRKYLERYPESRDALQEYARQGILNVMLAGETVQDSNMPAAEGLIRNYLLAMPFYHELVGEDHPALKLAWLEDAFGNSPNLPQILRSVGAEVACKLSYRTIPQDKHVWVGIDGSHIAVLDNHPKLCTGGFDKHPPCYHCLGAGCAACDNTGIYFVDRLANIPVAKTIEDAVALDAEWAVVYCDYEEFRADQRWVAAVNTLREQYAGQCDIRFANYTDVYARHLPTLQAAAAQCDDKPSPDLNPGMPGCYVTHIKNKQRARAIAYKILTAEAALASEGWRWGEAPALPAAFEQAWQLVLFNQFHDAITGTHIDAANDELMGMYDRAEALIQPYLPKQPHKPSPGKFTTVKETSGSIRLGNLNVDFDRCGITSVRCEDEDLFGSYPHAARFLRHFRIGELVVEDDWGDAWGMRKSQDPQMDFTAMGLGDYHTSVKVAKQAIRWKGKYTGNNPAIKKLKWTVTVTPSADGRRLDFAVTVNWDTYNRRLRVYVPVKSEDNTATYEVPFGFIDRDYDESKLDFSEWKGNSMDFPALHWVNKRIDAQRGVAVLNKGLPCYRWVPGRLDLSLLRSPTMPFCNVSLDPHDFWDIDGWRDTGKHHFEFSLLPYTQGMREVELARIGYAYNLPASIAPPFRIDGDIVVTAWKPAQDGSGWILRLYDAGGNGTPVALEFDTPRQVTRTNLLEQPEGDAVTTQLYETTLHRHGILTVHVR